MRSVDIGHAFEVAASSLFAELSEEKFVFRIFLTRLPVRRYRYLNAWWTSERTVLRLPTALWEVAPHKLPEITPS